MALGNTLRTEIDYAWRFTGGDRARVSMAGIARGAGIATTAIVAAGAALFTLADQMTRAPAEIQDMANRTGIAAQELAALGYIAQQDGASLQSLQTGIRTMSAAITDANAGLVTYQRAFEQIGVDYTQLASMRPEEQFRVLADAVGSLEDETLKMSVAQDLFGRGGMMLIPTLERGSEGIAAMTAEAQELGIILENDAYAKSKQFQDALLEMKSALRGVLLDAIVPLLPRLEEMGRKVMAIGRDAIPILMTAAGALITTLDMLVGAINLAADGWSRILRIGQYDTTQAFVTIASEAQQTIPSIDDLTAAFDRLYMSFPGLRPGTADARAVLGGWMEDFGGMLGGALGGGEVTVPVSADVSGAGGGSPIEPISKDAKDLLATSDLLKVAWTDIGAKFGEVVGHSKTMAEQQKMMTVQLAEEAAQMEAQSLQRRQQMYQSFASTTSGILRSAFRGATIDMEALFSDALANMASKMIESGLLKLLGGVASGGLGFFL